MDDRSVVFLMLGETLGVLRTREEMYLAIAMIRLGKAERMLRRDKGVPFAVHEAKGDLIVPQCLKGLHLVEVVMVKQKANHSGKRDEEAREMIMDLQLMFENALEVGVGTVGHHETQRRMIR